MSDEWHKAEDGYFYNDAEQWKGWRGTDKGTLYGPIEDEGWELPLMDADALDEQGALRENWAEIIAAKAKGKTNRA